MSVLLSQAATFSIFRDGRRREVPVVLANRPQNPDVGR